METVKNNLAELVQDKYPEYTMADVARATGLTPNAVARYWRNQVTRFDADALTALCKFLDCRIDELLVMEPEGA